LKILGRISHPGMTTDQWYNYICSTPRIIGEMAPDYNLHKYP